VIILLAESRHVRHGAWCFQQVKCVFNVYIYKPELIQL
jgi:hypothetical protein